MSWFEDLPFTPDRFQLEAAAHIDAGHSVVVVAPTGAGKTLIAEYAVDRAMSRGARAFYTTPIKALSNQKFADFRARYGEAKVGLLTGDNVINGEAPVVVMTTEVLRNMIYAESPALDELGVVILDEVHYLQNRYRGSVWEEVIIHLPQSVSLVCLSATIANPDEFTGWVRQRRGNTEVVVESHRPVPLESLYMVKDRFRDHQIEVFPVFGKGRRPNPAVVRMLAKERGHRRRFAIPRRLEVVETLAEEHLLPAIYFIFSRAGCDQAAETVAAARRLTTGEEQREIRERVGRLTDHLPERDLAALGFGAWVARLERGVAAHHAGMVPAFKETVEDLFTLGLVKIVFATETLALGINMPARTVVLERLSKFTGESHETLQPGDYTQLTGRAGRRGIDSKGSAVVLHNFDLPFERIAGIAAEGSHPLVSSFQPTYNMAANLVANYERSAAEELLNASFAQFRSEQRRAQLTEKLAERTAELEEFRAAASCNRGDIWAYLDSRGGTGMDHTAAMRGFVQRFRSGDVLQLTEDPTDLRVLLARGWGGNPRLLLLGKDGAADRLGAEQLSPVVAVVGHMALPEPVRTRDRDYRRAVAEMLANWTADPAGDVDRFADGDEDPVATCPRWADHMQWVRRVRRAERELRRLQRRLEKSDRGLVPLFRRILKLLASWGYVRGWELTPKGEQLRFVYNELDLLLTEAVDRGLLDGLNAPELAAVASLFTFEARRSDVERRAPTGTIAARVESISALARSLNEAEVSARLPETRLPEDGFTAVAHAWASGVDFEDMVEDGMVAGDFVRNCRQVIDLLRQLRDRFPGLGSVAAQAVKRVDRGVVAAGGRL